jgi:hypothetical protein
VTEVSFGGVSASFPPAANNNLDLGVSAVVPTNAISGLITVTTPHGVVTSSTAFHVEAPLSLAVHARPGGQIELDWPEGTIDVTLEATDALGTGAIWKTVPGIPVHEGALQKLILTAENRTGYFRLHGP